MSPLSRIRSEESGVAMVIAMMVVFIVVILSTVILDLSIHNADQAAYDRKRVTSIAAAEAGIDRSWNTIQYTEPEDLPCGSSVTETIEAEPAPATVTIDYTWYDSAGTALVGCPSDTNLPGRALVTATGQVNGDVPRAMQTYVTLSPNYGGFGSAVQAVTNTTFSNAFTINGYKGNDGNIYVTDGDLLVNNSMNVSGNVYVPNGGATMENGAQISGELWANEAIDVQNPAIVGTNLISSTAALTGDGDVGGFAMAGTTVDPDLDVAGDGYEYSPQGPPPTVEFPKLCQTSIAGVCDAMPWTGYTVNTFNNCAAARAFLVGAIPAGDQLVWINAVCTLNIQNNDVISFTNRNLAIVTQGGISMANRNTWSGTSGKSLFLIVNYRTIFPASCAAAYDIATGQLTRFQGAATLLYSPCTVTVQNLNGFAGQVLGRSVDIRNNFMMSYTPVLVPGLDVITGFDQSIVYIREVVS